MNFTIREVVDIEKEKQRILDYLLPNEKKALFLVGNIKEKDFPGCYFVAERYNNIIGVSAYFPIFKSFSLFTTEKDVSKRFVDEVVKKYPVEFLLGIKVAAKDAYLQFLKLGFISLQEPKQVFMEVDIEKNFKPFSINEGTIREVREKDIDEIVILNRHLHKEAITKAITEEERQKVFHCKDKFCLEINGKIVSGAMSNGIAYKAFQILSVVTLPEYRNRGFAKAVCSYLIKYFQKKYLAKEAIIFTSYTNIAAIHCYRSLGFEITDEYYFAMIQSNSR